jgi:hypothetical protein
MQNQLFEAALGISRGPSAASMLTIGIDFVGDSRFAAPGVEGGTRSMTRRPSGCGTSISSSTNAFWR